MKKTNNSDLETEVTIKLKKWQVPYLVGASMLGTWAEDWCAGLVQTSNNCYDSHSGRWIARVSHIIDQIKAQTSIPTEEKEYGYDEVLLSIDKWVDEQCEKNTKSRLEWEEAEYRKYEATHPKTIEVEKK